MASAVTIDRPDVVAMVENIAALFTDGDKVEAVALALRHYLDSRKRTGSPFDALKGTVTVAPGVDLTAPFFDDMIRDGLMNETAAASDCKA